MEKGFLTIVLHGHLPFVRHPEHAEFLEEDWLYEAITETYIPLINVFDQLLDEGIDFRVTISLSPTLVSMLNDPLLNSRYLRHIEQLIELAHKEVERTTYQPDFHHLAQMYRDKFLHTRYVFAEKYHSNIITAFKKFSAAGKVEIITCGATHGFLPLMDPIRKAAQAQVRIAADYHQSIFGQRPRGIWLPECGYNPGDDEFLKQEGIRFFFTDTHGILHGSPRPKYGVFAPVYCPSGVAAFGRDVESSRAVWSAQEGYPGDPDYREFYRDVGFDLDYDYIRPYIHVDGTRIFTGIKYYRITGRTEQKEPYNPHWAYEKTAQHAGNFIFNRHKQIEHLNDYLKIKPIIVCPYDAELYGHWWYEGPHWLNFLFRKLHYDQDMIRPITPSEYLDEHQTLQMVTPSMSTWGWKGYNEFWLNDSNDWIYRHLHKMAERMIELAGSFPAAEGITRRALNQAAREVALAQCSDWAFIMKTGTVVPYAMKRTKEHISNFNRLYKEIKGNQVTDAFLSDLEYRNNIFPNINYRAYA